MLLSCHKVHIKWAFSFFLCSSAVVNAANGVAGSTAGKWLSAKLLCFDSAVAVLCSSRTSTPADNMEGKQASVEGSHRFFFPSNKSVKAVRENHNTENDSVSQSIFKGTAWKCIRPVEYSDSHGVSITQSLKITPASLSGCIVQSNFRCASCVLQHLLLHYVKCTTSFHGKISRQSLRSLEI